MALAGVLCLTAGMGAASEVTVQQFVLGPPTSVFTYTSETIGDFALPDVQGTNTLTYTLPVAANYPSWEVLTGTVPSGWMSFVLMGSSMPDGDQSWYETITDTVLITPTNQDFATQDLVPYTTTVLHLEVSDNNEDFYVIFTNIAIPEPATAILLGASALSLLLCRVRRRHARK